MNGKKACRVSQGGNLRSCFDTVSKMVGVWRSALDIRLIPFIDLHTL